MTASAIPVDPTAPGREGADVGLVPQVVSRAVSFRVADIGAFSPRRDDACAGASLTLAGKLRGMTLPCGFPVLSCQVKSLDRLSQRRAGPVVGEASVHAGIMRGAHAACHGAKRVGGAP